MKKQEEKGVNPRWPGASSLSQQSNKKRTSEEELLFYRKQGWVSLLNKFVGLKASSFGSRMSSTKKEEMFVEISNF